ncbi:MAG: hypothetical protein EP329_27405 [Deltaproteobacteria bacterium]|nr:MAG: hypothetical protein EP329_27405 [Deltaproteobacteria bacterium]
MQGTDRQRLDARIGHGDGWTALRLDGVIDEHNGLAGLTPALGPKTDTLLLDLGGVRRINSVGVRDWVVWLKSQRERYRHVVLFDCPPAIMNEVNLVRNFAEGALITTFRAPYYCDRCGQESVQTLDAPAMIAQDVRKAPPFPCGKPACANALDDAEETYFAFFDDQRDLARPANLDALVAAAREALAAASTVTHASAPIVEKPLDLRAAEARLAMASVPTGAPVPGDGQRPGRQDPVFIAILVVMLGILGVLVYLIATLE